jgi:hypothetical protein
MDGTNGAALTTANSGFTSIIASGSATAVYSTGAAFQGSTGAVFTSDGTNASIAVATFNASCTQCAISIAFKIPASTPAADYGVFTVYDTSSARCFGFAYRSNGYVIFNDKGNTYTTLLTAAQATANTYFRFEIQVSALSTTAGTFSVQVYNAAGTQVGSTVNVSNGNLGTTAMSYTHLGATTATAFTATLDSLQLNDGSTSPIGLLSTATPPTASATVSNNISVIDASASHTNDSGTLTFSISPGTGLTLLAPGIWKATPQSTSTTYTYTVTDSVGSSNTATGTAVVPAATATGIASKVLVGGVWT